VRGWRPDRSGYRSCLAQVCPAAVKVTMPMSVIRSGPGKIWRTTSSFGTSESAKARARTTEAWRHGGIAASRRFARFVQDLNRRIPAITKNAEEPHFDAD